MIATFRAQADRRRVNEAQEAGHAAPKLTHYKKLLMHHIRVWRRAGLNHRALRVEKQRHDPHAPIADAVADNAEMLQQTQEQVRGLAESIQRIERMLMNRSPGDPPRSSGEDLLVEL